MLLGAFFWGYLAGNLFAGMRGSIWEAPAKATREGLAGLAVHHSMPVRQKELASFSEQSFRRVSNQLLRECALLADDCSDAEERAEMDAPPFPLSTYNWLRGHLCALGRWDGLGLCGHHVECIGHCHPDPWT